VWQLLVMKENHLSGIHKPAVSGLFYPGNSSQLKIMMDDFLKPSLKNAENIAPLGIIVPHAGYIYSGQCAADAYSHLKGHEYDTAIILGPAHRVWYPGASVFNNGEFETPLGNLTVDEELAQSLISIEDGADFRPEVFKGEHSIEVHLPFLKYLFPEIKVVPVLLGDMPADSLENFSSRLSSVMAESDKKILLIASTDFSHFYPQNKAEEMDHAGKNYILENDPEGLLRASFQEETSLCGIYPVYVTLKTLTNFKVNFISYRHSGQVSGDNSSVVGYMSFVLYPHTGE
jgi:AmmeMemoRadiSam system protein B